jgi:DNA-directed RNA polymerase subunit RPC12/RpoP
METRIKPELELNRKVCTSCGQRVMELTPDIQLLQKYVCTDCMM